MTKLEIHAFAAALNTPAADVVLRHPGPYLGSFEARRLKWLDEARARHDRQLERAELGVAFNVDTYEALAKRRRAWAERHAYERSAADLARIERRRSRLQARRELLVKRLAEIDLALQELP